jgi:hypothetical protein
MTHNNEKDESDHITVDIPLSMFNLLDYEGVEEKIEATPYSKLYKPIDSMKSPEDRQYWKHVAFSMERYHDPEWGDNHREDISPNFREVDVHDIPIQGQLVKSIEDSVYISLTKKGDDVYKYMWTRSLPEDDKDDALSDIRWSIIHNSTPQDQNEGQPVFVFRDVFIKNSQIKNKRAAAKSYTPVNQGDGLTTLSLNECHDVLLKEKMDASECIQTIAEYINNREKRKELFCQFS